jgi:Kef-type K+ transport system membrane component KefB
LLTVAAILGKLACGAVAPKGVSGLTLGLGMMPRGEVGLIFAGIGASLTLHGQPILAQSAFSAIVVMVVITTLVTPIGLQWAFSRTTRRAKGTPR